MKRMYLPQAQKYLAAAVETQGRDFRYNITPNPETACFYTPHSEFGPDDPRSKTGCIVGTALKLAQVPDDVIKNMSTWIRDHIFGEEFTLSNEARDYLYEAQKVQDAGGTWGEAYDAAEAWLSAQSR